MMDGDLSEGAMTSVALSDNNTHMHGQAGINGSSLNYNPTAPSALGFGVSRNSSPASAPELPSPVSVPNTRPDSLPHYNNYYTTTTAGGGGGGATAATNNGAGNSNSNSSMMMPNTAAGGLGGSNTAVGGGGMSASFSAPNSLNNAASSPTSPSNENGGGAGAVRSASAGGSSALLRSNSTLSSTSTTTANSKMENIRSWSISTYKCTKQLLSEKLGKSSRTVDTELETSIEALRDTQRKYSQVLRLARALSSHFYHVVNTQHQLGDAFADLAQKSPELQEEFIYNSETQRTLSRNGETLLNALNFFVSSVNTLCNKTMEDTLATIKQYEQARIEYDAYRSDLEALSTTPRSQVSSIKLDEAQRNFTAQKNTYDQLRADVAIKLKFLNENKCKVMHKQLLLFHNAVSAYFTGNEAQLEAALKQFNIKPRPPNTGPPSWLEQSLPETLQETFGSIFGENRRGSGP